MHIIDVYNRCIFIRNKQEIHCIICFFIKKYDFAELRLSKSIVKYIIILYVINLPFR